MPEPTRRPREVVRRRDVYTEPDGLFGRIADLVIENPVRSGGFVMVVMAAAAIISNAAYFQTARHPDPFFVTREPDAAATPTAPLPKYRAPKPTADAAAASGKSTSATATPGAKSVPTAAVSPDDGLVSATQSALAALGLYGGLVDGKLGPQTRAAISAFEMKTGLIPTGKPSADLLKELRKRAPQASAVDPAEPAAPSDPVATGSIDVAAATLRMKRIQGALNDIGYGPLRVDGKGGGGTSDAIRRFELDNGLELSGEATDAVVAKLVKIGAMKPIQGPGT